MLISFILIKKKSVMTEREKKREKKPHDPNIYRTNITVDPKSYKKFYGEVFLKFSKSFIELFIS